MPCFKVFSEVIGKIFLARVPANLEMVSVDLVGNPEESHFHGSQPFFLTVLLAIPVAVLLSQCVGVGD